LAATGGSETIPASGFFASAPRVKAGDVLATAAAIATRACPDVLQYQLQISLLRKQFP
jgi:hypothetical protein